VTVTGRARFNPLLEFLQDIALYGDMGFEIVLKQFRCYVPKDRSASVIFSPEYGNVLNYDYAAEAGSGNYAYVGGGGEGTARTIYELGYPPSLLVSGRIEMFVDRRDTTDTGELKAEAETRFQDKIESLNINVVPSQDSVSNMRAFTDYYLGDLVTVVPDGIAVTAQIQEVGIVCRKDEVHERATVGTFGENSKNLVPGVKQLDENSKRLVRLEVR
jgi:hypothetical protein